MLQKIKQFIESEKGKDLLVVTIVILVGLASFGLGRLSKNLENNGVLINYPKQPANASKGLDKEVNNEAGINPKEFIVQNPNLDRFEANTSSKAFFASKRGKKYYSMDCSAGKNIKTENRIYFDSNEQAEKAGYSLSSACE